MTVSVCKDRARARGCSRTSECAEKGLNTRAYDKIGENGWQGFFPSRFLSGRFGFLSETTP
jgi:hypothetical protein